MSEFARGGTTASTDPVALSAVNAEAGATARPAVLVDETTVPVRPARTEAPMDIAPPTAQVTAAEQPDQGIATSAVNLNQLPAQPQSKLLTPEEKAKVIAELEALAKKQSAALDKDKKSTCAAENVDPATRVVSATGDGGC